MRFPSILMAAATQGGGAPPDSDLVAWVAAVVANGGTVSAGRTGLVGQLIAASKACGHWAATDDIALMAAENATQALTTLKGRRLMTVTAAPTFTADRGYAFNGTTQYIDTNANLSSTSVAMTGTNVRLGAYETVNLQSATTTIGATVTGVSTISLRSRSASTTMVVNLTGGAGTLTIGADSRGLKVASRNGNTTVKGWDRGVALSDVTVTTQDALPSANLFIGARSNSGTPDQFRAATIAACEWGASLPGGTTAELDWYNALQAHLTAIGAAV